MRTHAIVLAALLCGACSSESPTRREPPPAVTKAADPTSADPSSPVPSSDFGNAATHAPVADAGIRTAAPSERPACSPGLYLGTYDCEISIGGLPFPLMGDVSFDLSINEMTVPGECDDEFCGDLVISENSGTLFGLAGLTGFETQLQGALDCASGEFRATGLGGRWGNPISTDPNDPDALWTVEDPPFGMFSGELSGTHMQTSSGETIAGTWNLREDAMDITCAGPFSVMLQP